MKLVHTIHERRQRRQRRTRAKIFGTAKRPRLSVFRSNRAFYVQLIDDERGVTLASVSSRDADTKLKKTEQAFRAGELLAEKAKAQHIGSVVFDKGRYQYHGRVKACAEGARKGGLQL